MTFERRGAVFAEREAEAKKRSTRSHSRKGAFESAPTVEVFGLMKPRIAVDKRGRKREKRARKKEEVSRCRRKTHRSFSIAEFEAAFLKPPSFDRLTSSSDLPLTSTHQPYHLTPRSTRPQACRLSLSAPTFPRRKHRISPSCRLRQPSSPSRTQATTPRPRSTSTRSRLRTTTSTSSLLSKSQSRRTTARSSLPKPRPLRGPWRPTIVLPRPRLPSRRLPLALRSLRT